MFTSTEAKTLTDREERIAYLADVLRNHYEPEDFFAIAGYAYSWDGLFDWANLIDIDDLGEYGLDVAEAVHAVVCGDVLNMVYPVRFNAYANLESVTPTTMEGDQARHSEELAEYIVDQLGYAGEVDSMLFYQEEQDVLKAWEDYDEREEN